MTEEEGRPGPPRQLLRLVRQLTRGECRVSAAGENVTVTGHEERRYPGSVIREACSRGLATLSGERLVASPEAGAFLRRALVMGEDAFAEQHGKIVRTSVGIGESRLSARRNLDESPLGAVTRLKDRAGGPFLPQDAIDAGERLLADFTRAQLQPRVTAAWEPRLSTRTRGEAGGQAEIAGSALAARLRFGKAVEAMGPELSGVAVDVCCFSKGLETVERERQWPARSAKLMLRAALLSLARHYAPPVSGARRTHHWGADGYRPAL